MVSFYLRENDSMYLIFPTEPEQSLTLSRGESDATHQNFTCQATEAYPQPALYIYKDGENQHPPTYDR